MSKNVRSKIVIIFPICPLKSTHSYIFGAQKNHLKEMVLLGTDRIYFG